MQVAVNSAHVHLRRVYSCTRAPRQPALWRLRTCATTRPAQERQPKSKSKRDKDSENVYSSTLNLPKTDFNIRANAKETEPQIQKFWEDSGVYKRLVQENAGEEWTLHDGPPYANGELHTGHAMNKVLKDIIVRRKLMEGRRASFVPGWDTHGLPIELKVLQTLSAEERAGLSPLQLREKAKAFAMDTVSRQREQFKRFGCWGDWEVPYVTLQPEYEAAQLGVFGKMLEKGHIYRGFKPVHWSPSSGTALAEAELEYPEGHKSPAVYVGFPLESVPEGCDAGLADALTGAAFTIWTTTPWTLPANAAVAVNANLQYTVVQLPEDLCPWLTCRRLVVAADLLPAVAAKLKTDAAALAPLATVSGAALEGATYRHPLFDRTSPVVVGGDYITTETGTGLVHTAPGHGQEDFLVGKRCGLPLLSPVDADGKFTVEAGQFQGLAVQTDGNKAVIAALREGGVLLHREDYRHKYPYDWRTKKPTIFRATEQWFASVDGFKAAALAAIKEVSWMPAVGQNRITAMTDSRTDWCISRQRTWGVPIPVFYYKADRRPLMNAETIAHVQTVVRKHGSSAWWQLEVADLLPESLRGEADQLEKGTDTMDVWFDSGASWAAVIELRPDLRFPADLYLEGSDQHRGWFQSSLLTAVATVGSAPYRGVLTHGFVLDEKGNKMSKSLGNTIDPKEIIEGGKNLKKQPAYGADVLRLWVASVDYTLDVSIGQNIMKQVFEAYRKLRGTIRYLLGSVSDFQPGPHTIPLGQLPALDRLVLHKLRKLMIEIDRAYETHSFGTIYRAVNLFVSAELSSFYFELCKDRAYIRDAESYERRACQTVMHTVLETLLTALAPILPHTCEDAWQCMHNGDCGSVFEGGLRVANPAWEMDIAEEDVLRTVFAVREVALKALEAARMDKLIGAPLEAHVRVHVTDGEKLEALKLWAKPEDRVDKLRYLFVTSQVTVVDTAAEAEAGTEYVSRAPGGDGAEITCGVVRADGARCERCWNYSTKLGEDEDHPQLCERCSPVVKRLGFSLPDRSEAAVPSDVA